MIEKIKNLMYNFLNQHGKGPNALFIPMSEYHDFLIAIQATYTDALLTNIDIYQSMKVFKLYGENQKIMVGII